MYFYEYTCSAIGTCIALFYLLDVPNLNTADVVWHVLLTILSTKWQRFIKIIVFIMILFKIVGLQYLERIFFFQYVLKYSSHTDLLFLQKPSWVQGLNQIKIWKFLYLFFWKIYCICFSFLDSTKRCHIDCSILSSAPPLSHMNRVYRILTIEVLLLSDSNGFNLQSSCLNSNPSLIIKIGCEGEFIHSNVLFFKISTFYKLSILNSFIAEVYLSTINYSMVF